MVWTPVHNCLNVRYKSRNTQRFVPFFVAYNLNDCSWALLIIPLQIQSQHIQSVICWVHLLSVLYGTRALFYIGAFITCHHNYGLIFCHFPLCLLVRDLQVQHCFSKSDVLNRYNTALKFYWNYANASVQVDTKKASQGLSGVIEILIICSQPDRC